MLSTHLSISASALCGFFFLLSKNPWTSAGLNLLSGILDAKSAAISSRCRSGRPQLAGTRVLVAKADFSDFSFVGVAGGVRMLSLIGAGLGGLVQV